MSMNVLLLPNGNDRLADGAAEAQIRTLGMVPVRIGSPVAIEAVVLVDGADSRSHLAAGVFLGRNYPVAYYAPHAGPPDADGVMMFHAGTPTQLRNWLDDLYTRAMQVVPQGRRSTKRGEPR